VFEAATLVVGQPLERAERGDVFLHFSAPAPR
jgi:hypothetical protein